jgi:hypothetical protein
MAVTPRAGAEAEVGALTGTKLPKRPRGRRRQPSSEPPQHRAGTPATRVHDGRRDHARWGVEGAVATVHMRVTVTDARRSTNRQVEVRFRSVLLSQGPQQNNRSNQAAESRTDRTVASGSYSRRDEMRVRSVEDGVE